MPLTPWQELAFDPRIGRAIEISLAGRHSLRLIGHPGNGEEHFRALASGPASVRYCFPASDHPGIPICSACVDPQWLWAKPCACGYLGDPAKDCPCSPRLCERFTRRINSDPFDLSLRIIQPRAHQLAARDKCETLDVVLNRIEERSPMRDAIPGILDPAGRELLGAAHDRLGFTLDQRSRALSVARTIAALCGSPVVRVSHVAEAIHYQDVRI